MDWLERMNQSLDYIEEHLTADIDNTELAKIVCCSAYHFTRMFSFISGITLSEYIRRRRLSMAALELQNSNVKIVDLALKYRYDSPTAFTRAFRSMHGVAPTDAKNAGVRLKSYPKMSFLITIKGDVSMNYRIENKERFTVVGLKERMTGTVDSSENANRMMEIWSNLTEEKTSEIMSLSNGYIHGLIGITAHDNGTEFDYYVAATTDNKTDAPNMNLLDVPASTWAVFDCVGALPDSIGETWKRIFAEWFPSSGYENADSPCLEVYFDGDVTSDDYRCELWLPVIKSKL